LPLVVMKYSPAMIAADKRPPARAWQPSKIGVESATDSASHRPFRDQQSSTQRTAMMFSACRLKHASDRRKDERGFTLLELLVVLAVLGLLIGLVAPAALRQLGSAKTKIAAQSIERIAGVLDMYKLDVGTYPTTDQGLQALITRPSGVNRWSGPYLKGEKLPEDPWGKPYVYRSPSQRPGHEYDLYTLGPTGQAGGTGENAPIYNN
jgi:general secretion pathway protein G